MSNATSEFLATIFGDLDQGEFVEIRYLNPTAKPGFYQDAEGAAKAALLHCNSSDVYFGIATRDGNGGKNDNVVRIPCAWADLDAKDHLEPPQTRLERCPLKPSAVVCSGMGLHCYWCLSEPLGKADIPRIEKLNKGIAQALDGDSVHDVARVLRVPGTLNHKYGDPLPVTLQSLDPTLCYAVSDLEAAFPPSLPDVREVKPSTLVAKACGGSQLPCREVLWQGVAEGQRNPACFQLALDLKKQGDAETDAVGKLTKWNKGNRPPLSENELRNTITSVYSTEYAGLGCDKHPMLDFCQPNCPVRNKATEHLATPQIDLEDTTPALSVWTWQALLMREVVPPEFVVDGLIPRRGVTLLMGEGGIGKSFVVIDLAYSVGSGGKFLYHFDCTPGGVLIVDLENDEATIARRIQKINAGRHEVDGSTCAVPVFIVRKDDLSAVELRIDEEKGKDALCKLVEQHRPQLLVIDPLVAIHGSDENDNLKMRQLIMRLQDIARRFDLAVVLVHHLRKRGVINDAGQMIRGASDLRNAVDSHLSLRKVSKEQAIVEHDKSRHAPPVAKFTIEMKDSEDGNATFIRYCGAATDSLEKEAAARECITSILQECAECRPGELIGRAKAQGVAKSTAERAIKSLKAERRILQPVERGPYRLAVEEPALDF